MTSMKRFSRAVVAPVLLGLTAVSWAFPWDKDMVDQPTAKPQESEAPMESSGVPVEGGETMPAPVTEAGMFEAKDAAVLLENPVPATLRVRGPRPVSLPDQLSGLPRRGRDAAPDRWVCCLQRRR